MAELLNLSEDEKRRRHLKTTPTERYHMFMHLFRLGKAMQRAVPAKNSKNGSAK
ncbi:MAG: hypothetical protein JNL57_06740 [Bacteroidetes bacterium]|nr:hypothetical protein [Bacteroidota bacterium]